MTEHLPECLHSRPCERAVRGTGDRHVVSGGRCDNCDDPCICPALRACTVRVLGEAREAVEPKTREIGYVSNMDAGYIGCAEDVLSDLDRLAREAP